jgi:hypothetical protein
MRPLGWSAVARWQAVVVARAASFAPLYWVAWMAYWTVQGYPR